jgi:hypothetical protein
VVARPIAAPLVVDLGENHAGAVAGPNRLPDADLGDGLKLFAARKIADAQLEPLRPVIVGEGRQQLAVGADLERAKPEVFAASSLCRLVENDLVFAATCWAAIPFAVLVARRERPPIEVVAVADGDGTVVFLDAALHLLKELVEKRPVLVGPAFEVSVFGV